MRIIHRSFFLSKLLSATLSTVLLSACGQTGPLYLPDNTEKEAIEPVDKPALEEAVHSTNDNEKPNHSQTQ